jgi:hypothetical protein
MASISNARPPAGLRRGGGEEDIHEALQRKAEVAKSAPERHTGLRAIAEELSLRNVDGATCELLNEALARLVHLAYEVDAGGLCNVDAVTGRFLIPLPWGRNGHSQWRLRRQEGNILREILFAWQKEQPALLLYDRSRRAWFVNLSAFGSIGIAKAWLRAHPVTIPLYRAGRTQAVAKC